MDAITAADLHTAARELAAEQASSNAPLVSRVLLKADHLRVLLFSFALGGELADHTAPGPVAIQVVSGRVEVTTDAKKTVMGPGGMLFLPPQLRHALLAGEPSVVLVSIGWPGGAE